MKRSPAFTIIEILVVMSLVGLMTLGGFTAFLTARNNQDLSQSTEHVIDTFRRAHIFSRDARDEKEWGVQSTQANSYNIVYRTDVSDTPHISTSYTLPSSVHFPASSSFEVWFGKGTGEIENPFEIVLETSNNQKTKITVERTGVVGFTTD